MTAVLPTVTGNPFVGPRAFATGERLYARERETRKLVDLLIAERIVLLYSPSGAGKTSLINAALVPELRAERFQVSPVVRVGLEQDDRASGRHNRYLVSTLLSLEGGLRPERQREVEELAALGLDRYVREWGQLDEVGTGNELLVFDQFEEILTVDPTDEEARQSFLAELGQALKNRGRWALFAMREDYVAGLDPYLALLPTKLRTRMRLDLLRESGAVQAITQPGRDAGREITDAAAQRLVDELRMVNVQRSGQRLELPGPFVEPVQLQVVCRRMWEALPTNVASIDVEHVDAVGDVAQALGEYYAEKIAVVATETGVSERVLREWVEHDLITEGGFRAQRPHGPSGVGAAETEILRLLEGAHLIRAEDRRGTRWLELAHDRLVEPVLADNARWRLEHLAALQRQAALWHDEGRRDTLLLTGPAFDEAADWVRTHADDLMATEREFWDACVAARNARRHQRRTRRIVSALVLCSIAVVVAVVTRATQSAVQAESGQHAAAAVTLIERDPTAAVQRALSAIEKAPTAEAKGALRRSLATTRPTWVLQGHNVDVVGAEFSPDPNGARLLTAGQDGTARLWDFAHGRELAVLPHDGPVTKAVFSSDGELLLTVAAQQAYVWQVDDPHTPVASTDTVAAGDAMTTGAFSGDGQRFVTGTYQGAARLWSADGTEIASLEGHQGPVVTAAFDSSSDVVLTASSEEDHGGVVQLWEAETGEQRGTLHLDSSPRAAAFTPDGDMVAIGGADGGLRLWRWRESDEPKVIEASDLSIDALALSNSGDIIATASGKQVRIFHVSDGSPILDLREHREWVRSIEFSPDDELLLSAGADGVALLWNATTGTVLDELRGHTDGVHSARFDPSGSHVVTTSADGTARIWQPDLGEQTLQGPGGWLHQAEFSASGRLIVGAGSDGVARIWERESGRVLQDLEASGTYLTGASFSPDERYVVTASYEGSISVWDWAADELIAERPASTLHSPTFSHNGRLIATNTVEEPWKVQLWDWRADRISREMDGHWSDVISADFSPDGRHLATGSIDRTVRVWDLTTGRGTAQLVGHTGIIHSVDFNADGSRLVSVSREAARIWDPATGEELVLIDGHDEGVTTAAFTPDTDSTHVVTGDRGGTTGVWDAETGENLALLRKHADYVNTARFAPNGSVIMTASDDGTARIYACETCGSLETLVNRARRYVRDVGVQLRVLADSEPTVGDCFNALPVKIDCGTPHRSEVFAAVTHPAGPDAPFDQEAVDTYAREECQGERFEQFVGVPYDASSSYFAWSYGATYQASWEAGDREILCVVAPLNTHSVTGSAEGRGRATTDDASSAPAPGGASALAGLDIGTCFDDQGVIVQCDEPHTNEVFAIVTHPAATGTAITDAEIENFARSQCLGDLYRDYTGVAYADDSEHWAWWLAPNQSEWEAGARDIGCILSPLGDAETVGSARQSSR